LCPSFIKTKYNDTDLRYDPVAIQLVESMGNDANGCHSELTIFELSDELKNYFDIEDADGNEYVNINFNKVYRDLFDKVIKEGILTEHHKLSYNRLLELEKEYIK
jgi:hypothetical protein